MHWHVGVMGIVEGETLATGDTVAEAVEFSFLPLRAYIESGLEPGYLPVRRELDLPATLELGRLADLVAEADEFGVMLMISTPQEPSEQLRVLFLTGNSSVSVGQAETLADAVELALEALNCGTRLHITTGRFLYRHASELTAPGRVVARLEGALVALEALAGPRPRRGRPRHD